MTNGGTKNTSGRGQRELRVKVKTAKGRKLSSTRWLERQLNDPYVARARREGFRGRAAFKKRSRLLRPAFVEYCEDLLTRRGGGKPVADRPTHANASEMLMGVFMVGWFFETRHSYEGPRCPSIRGNVEANSPSGKLLCGEIYAAHKILDARRLSPAGSALS